MARVVFDVSASPFLLQAVLKKHISLFADDDEETTTSLKRDIYCDDLLTSLKTEEEAVKFAKEAKRIPSDA